MRFLIFVVFYDSHWFSKIVEFILVSRLSSFFHHGRCQHLKRVIHVVNIFLGMFRFFNGLRRDFWCGFFNRSTGFRFPSFSQTINSSRSRWCYVSSVIQTYIVFLFFFYWRWSNVPQGFVRFRFWLGCIIRGLIWSMTGTSSDFRFSIWWCRQFCSTTSSFVSRSEATKSPSCRFGRFGIIVQRLRRILIRSLKTSMLRIVSCNCLVVTFTLVDSIFPILNFSSSRILPIRDRIVASVAADAPAAAPSAWAIMVAIAF